MPPLENEYLLLVLLTKPPTAWSNDTTPGAFTHLAAVALELLAQAWRQNSYWQTLGVFGLPNRAALCQVHRISIAYVIHMA